MEQEKILSSLTERLGETQFSERTLNAYIDSHPVAEGAEPDEAYFESAANFFKSLEGQYRHDVAEGIKKAGTPPVVKPSNDTTPSSNDNELKELREKVASLEKAQKEQVEKVTQTELAQKVKKAMKEQNATDDYVLEQTFRGITLDPAKSVDDLAKDMLAKYDAEYKACRGEGAPPRQNTTGGGGGKTETRSDRFFAKKSKKEGWSKK